MADPRSPTRADLAKFLPDQRSIRAFEKLFELVPDELSEVIEEALIQAGTADARSQQAIDLLSSIADSLETLAKAPPTQKDTFLKGDYLDLPFNGPHIQKERRLQWNDDDGTIDVGLYGGSVLQVGQEVMFYAKNDDGSNLSNGTPVMFKGAVGVSGKLTFQKAVSDGSVLPDYMMGVTTQDIDNNAFGYVTTFGLVRGLRTDGNPQGETWNDGDLLYFDPTTPGDWTNIKPTAPAIKHPFGVVVTASSGNNGSIFVRMAVDEALSGLQDVHAPTLTNYDLLNWISANNRFEVTDTPRVNGLVVDKTAGNAIKIDKDSPDYGFEDMLGEIVTRGVGATDPNFQTYIGNIKQYEFSVNDEAWLNFHILHDYAPNTDMFIHAHWSHNSAAVTSGSVTWEFEITYAKGHDQAPFPTTKTITVTQTASTTQYQHMIAEVQFTTSGGSATQIDSDDIEVDGIIMVRCRLLTNTMNGGVLPFLHFVDIHYQSTGIKTKNKAPNFYT